jgi:DNA ligase-1
MFIEPMLLGKIDTPFDDDKYIHEVKLNGHRVVFTHNKGVTKLYTRHKNDCSLQYPEIIQHLPTDDDVILDGEMVCIPPGSEDIEFEAVMDRFRLSKQDKIQIASRRQPVSAVVWDILFLNGRDLRKEPLIERKKILANVVGDNAFVSKVPFVEGEGTRLFELIRSRGWEGICSKPKASRYISGEAGRAVWKKIINYEYTEVYLSGYQKESYGWLSAIRGEDGSLKPGGVIELAITPDHRKQFYKKASGIVTGEDRNFVYIEPALRGIVRHRGWTRNGLLSLPEFVSFVT